MLHPKTRIFTNEGVLSVSKVMAGMIVLTPEGERSIGRCYKGWAGTVHYRINTTNNLVVIFDRRQYFFSADTDELVLGKRLKHGDWIKTRDGKAMIDKLTLMGGLSYPGYFISVYSRLNAYYLANGVLVGAR